MVVSLMFCSGAAVEDGGFLCRADLSWEVHALINCHVHFFQEDAVSWNSTSLINFNDITDNQLSHLNGNASTVGTSEHWNNRIVDLILETEELLLLYPVAGARDQSCKQQTSINSE